MQILGTHRNQNRLDQSPPCVHRRRLHEYDEHAVQQINRNIELLRYRHYDEGYLVLELVNSTTTSTEDLSATGKSSGGRPVARSQGKTVSEYYEQAPEDLKNVFDSLEAFALALGDDVTKKNGKALLRLPTDQELRLR